MTSNSDTNITPPRTIREVRLTGAVPLFRHPEWSERFPWLIQGTTGAGDNGDFDLRLQGNPSGDATTTRWRLLRETLGFPRVVIARQVHGTAVLLHHHGGNDGLRLAEAADGHATMLSELLLAVSVADCIPVSLVDPGRRAIALLHAGWRGVAAGIITEGVASLRRLAGSSPADLHLHLGPAICGSCYEVGPEVHAALGLGAPATRSLLDLRAIAAGQALRLGIPATHITSSAYCTRCDEGHFFSHRAGSRLRQVAVLGIRAEPDSGYAER